MEGAEGEGEGHQHHQESEESEEDEGRQYDAATLRRARLCAQLQVWADRRERQVLLSVARTPWRCVY